MVGDKPPYSQISRTGFDPEPEIAEVTRSPQLPKPPSPFSTLRPHANFGNIRKITIRENQPILHQLSLSLTLSPSKRERAKFIQVNIEVHMGTNQGEERRRVGYAALAAKSPSHNKQGMSTETVF